MAGYDQYGGWTEKRFEASGFFRTQKDGNRWWLVTPEGNAFLSLGINHYHVHWWDQEYNRGHWQELFGGTGPQDPRWIEGYRSQAMADLNYLRLNSLGIHTDSLLHRPTAIAPYMARYEPVEIPHYKVATADKFPDVFSEAFDELCDKTARESAQPIKDDPLVLGYAMTDCPIFTDLDAAARTMTVYGAPRPELPTWPRLLRNLGPAAPGKQAYTGTMKDRYTDVAAFNRVYGTEFSAWTDLLDATDWRPGTDYDNQTEIGDNTAFLRVCVDTYYRKAHQALRRYDENHLFFGDKLNANSDGLTTVIDITCRYTDLVFYQMYARYADQSPVLDVIAKTADLPIVNGDSAYSTVTEMIPDPYGPHAEDQTERAAWTREFAGAAFGRPEFVGWHICGLMDTWKTMAGKADKQHSGLKTPTGDYYPEMEEAVKTIAAGLYGFH